MKAIVIERFGGPEVFETVELPRPTVGAGEVLIEVKATSVNPVDWKMRSGLAPFLVPTFPAVLHPDCAGTVVEVGEGVDELAPGDEVYAFASGLAGKPGALAELMVADARMAARKPAAWSMEEAASLPLVWVTACLALLERTRIAPGSTLLIQGGTGGVGMAAIQLAAARLDATVCATCGSEAKCRIAEGLGAARAFDYRTASVEDMLAEATDGRGFDVIFNAPGQASVNASVEAAAFGGTILDINGAFPTAGSFHAKQLGFLSLFAGYPIVGDVDQEKVGRFLRELTALADAGRVRPLVDERRFTFATLGAAHECQEKGRPVGKVAVSATWEG